MGRRLYDRQQTDHDGTSPDKETNGGIHGTNSQERVDHHTSVVMK
jgi:hypothetical protein